MVPHDRNSFKQDIINVFNGQIPYLYVYFATWQDYFNRDPFVPPTYCSWEGLTNLHLIVHRQIRRSVITNSQQAYFHLRRVLHPNDDQEDQYTYIAYEIPTMEDSNLKVLPLNTKASLWVTVQYNTLNRKIQTFHVGFFHQGVNFVFLTTLQANHLLIIITMTKQRISENVDIHWHDASWNYLEENSSTDHFSIGYTVLRL